MVLAQVCEPRWSNCEELRFEISTQEAALLSQSPVPLQLTLQTDEGQHLLLPSTLVLLGTELQMKLEACMIGCICVLQPPCLSERISVLLWKHRLPQPESQAGLHCKLKVPLKSPCRYCKVNAT